jgi:hypothetical protein
MKRKTKKLTLSKTTILNLSSDAMRVVAGAGRSANETCRTNCAITCPGDTCGGTTFTQTCPP